MRLGMGNFAAAPCSEPPNLGRKGEGSMFVQENEGLVHVMHVWGAWITLDGNH